MKKRFSFKYSKSLFWLFFWIIVWVPIALMLIVLHGSFVSNHTVSYIKYHGSSSWLFFWTIFFVPISMILLILYAEVRRETLMEEIEASSEM